MIPVITDFIPVGRPNRPGLRLIGPLYITIHDTGNASPGTDALAHAAWLKRNVAAWIPVSYHFTVDDKRAVQHLPLDEIGWHAGDGRNGPGNRSSLGIEIAMNADGDRAKAETNAAILVAHYLKHFNRGLEAVVQHFRWNGKDCPRVLRNRPGGWDGFLREVKAAMETGIWIVVNGKTLAAEAENRGGKVWVPIRDVAEALGAKVSWHSPPPTVHIQTKGVVIGGIHLPPER